MTLKVKRIYEPPGRSDGLRILVDRMWPRGVTKAAAAVDGWLRDCAPSAELRKWFAHDPAKWREFKRRYAGDLREHADALAPVRSAAAQRSVTLLYAAVDTEHNNAVALREYIETTAAPRVATKRPRRRAASSSHHMQK